MILVDGIRRDTIPVADRGLQYGDGLFETIAVVDGRARAWQRHLDRLHRGCGRLRIPFPDPALLAAEADRLLADVSGPHVLKIMVTRGEGGRGYRPPAEPNPRRILSLHPWPDYPEHYRRDGVVVRICDARLACNAHLARIKHLNRLEQVLARSEWDDPAVAEGLMRGPHGDVIGGVQSNLFAVLDGRLYTPDVSECGVAGTTRARVISAARALDIPCRVEPLELDFVHRSDELFLTNAIMGIWPVRELAGASFSVGPMTRRLQEALDGQE